MIYNERSQEIGVRQHETDTTKRRPSKAINIQRRGRWRILNTPQIRGEGLGETRNNWKLRFGHNILRGQLRSTLENYTPWAENESRSNGFLIGNYSAKGGSKSSVMESFMEKLRSGKLRTAGG